jgi:hypothetical protein
MLDFHIRDDLDLLIQCCLWDNLRLVRELKDGVEGLLFNRRGL